jgi:hypothetical protein
LIKNGLDEITNGRGAACAIRRPAVNGFLSEMAELTLGPKTFGPID